MTSNHTVVCTFTNTRKTGTIKLKKHWVGTAGNASLAVGSSGPGSANVATGTANGADGDTGTSTVDTGTYFVSEAFDSNLYTKSLACFNDANNNGVNDSSDSAVTVGANDSVAVGSGQHVICTYTNTRKTGTIEVKKILNPAADTGTFDLTIDGTPYTNNGAGFGNNGTTGRSRSTPARITVHPRPGTARPLWPITSRATPARTARAATAPRSPASP